MRQPVGLGILSIRDLSTKVGSKTLSSALTKALSSSDFSFSFFDAVLSFFYFSRYMVRD
jgi:hypothetical protein